MTQKERRENGMLYNGYLKENISYQMQRIEDVYDFNNIRPQELKKKQESRCRYRCRNIIICKYVKWD